MTRSLVCATTVHFSRYCFTGKERDAESGNDYFGARYYASSMGRFMSPDWSAKEEPVPYAQLDDPQSLNLYAYVGNNPLDRIDADGHAPMSWGGFGSCGSGYGAVGCGAGSQTAADMAQQSAFNAQQTAQDQNRSGASTSDPSAPQVPGSPIHLTRFLVGDNGIDIAATGTCSGCTDWVQTITRTGTDDYFHREYVDKGNTTDHQDLYPTNRDRRYTPGLSNFADTPTVSRGGSWAGVLLVGDADPAKHTFVSSGAITYGISVGKGGRVSYFGPSAASRAQINHAMRTINADSSPWVASYAP